VRIGAGKVTSHTEEGSFQFHPKFRRGDSIFPEEALKEICVKLKEEEKKMKKAGLVLLVLMILVSYMVKDSEAAQWCWELSGVNQYIKVSVVKPDPLYPYWSLNGITYVPDMILLPVAGTMVKSADGTQRFLTLWGAYPPTGAILGLDAVIDAETKNGTCGILGIIPFSARETFPLQKVPCSTLPAP
jgi:hypothetical protein